MSNELERRTYLRDPQGTTTGGQFTANPSGAQTIPFSAQRPFPVSQGTSGGKRSPKAGVPASASLKTLRFGQENDPATVRDMQRLLKALGFITGGLQENGVFDDATEAAVKLVQTQLGVKKPNGVADRGLINKLLNAYDLSPCIKR